MIVPGMHTTAGSYALIDSVPARDATVTASLRANGAIILGKANMTEFGNFKGNIISHGWSSRGGRCRSAYVKDGCPSGSSSGCAVGLAAGFAAGAVGTEADGSLILPAARAALFAIKPTVGLVSRSGVFPLSFTQDSVGPMAKSVYDMALMLSHMAGEDTGDCKSTSLLPRKLPYIAMAYPLTTSIMHSSWYKSAYSPRLYSIYKATSRNLSRKKARYNAIHGL